MTLVDRIQSTLCAHKLFPERSRLLVAVSGGADSVALLHVLHALSRHYDWDVAVAHYHHGLRVEADADATFVEALAARLYLPCFMEKENLRALSENGSGLEALGRHKRYVFLAKQAQAWKATHVVVGHHADDQVETVLLHILRGSAWQGLKGMEWARAFPEAGVGVQIVRPFLSTRHSDLLQFLQDNALGYCEDTSNKDKDFLRNRIRHELLPLLREFYNSKTDEHILSLAEHVKHYDDVLRAYAQELWQSCVAEHSSEVLLHLKIWRTLSSAQRCQILYDILCKVQRHALGITSAQIKNMEQQFMPPAGPNRFVVNKHILCHKTSQEARFMRATDIEHE